MLYLIRLSSTNDIILVQKTVPSVYQSSSVSIT